MAMKRRLSLSRLAAKQPALYRGAAAGAPAACGVMFFRIAILLLTIEPALLESFGAALALTGTVLLRLGAWHRRFAQPLQPVEGQALSIEPFDLSSALVFGAFLGLMAMAVPAAKEWSGTSGVFAVSALSGLLDVDGIVISVARIHRAGDIAQKVAISALCLAICANMVSKVVIARVAGGRAIGKCLLQGYAIALLAGAAPVLSAIL